MNIQDKKDIRDKILKQRETIDVDTKNQWDDNIFNNLVNSELYKKAKTIFAFVSFKSEVDTHRIIKRAFEDKKIICVPKIESKQKGMEAVKINGFDQLKEGYFGILEPVEGCPAIDNKAIDLIFVPGVAFDKQGGRLGYGAAFYDRFLANIDESVEKIAIAYNFQILDHIPMDEHDVRIDGVITEEKIIFTKE